MIALERETAAADRARSPSGRPTRLVDTTMLYAPRSGGVKRYLLAKRDWLAANRPGVRHNLVLPGRKDAHDGQGLWSIYTAPLPFGKGYRWPVSKTAWMERLVRRRPTLIEAGDPYTPGLAALRAGEALGVPVVGFCHTDLPALAALHLGEWAEEPVRRRWSRIYNQFDAVLAPSRFVAQRLQEAGVARAQPLTLGADVGLFRPDLADRAALRTRLGLPADHRLLVFAGRPAREKRIDVMVEAVERLDPGTTLLLVGAGEAAPPSERVIGLPYMQDSTSLARLLASCDGFLHANPDEPLGLIVLEALACGLPVVGVRSGGVAETVDSEVGELAEASEPAALAEAIDALFARDLTEVSRRARARAVARHSWDAVFENLMEVYAGLTGDPNFAGAVAAREMH
ncbi:glycosyltransferase [Phenylobacterium terrae]|uniref:Glycosyltransferase n=1 Tax=Phenylobacterium terrae TaxID=2665495 RepID=A0ABW4N2Q8_9CAUL